MRHKKSTCDNLSAGFPVERTCNGSTEKQLILPQLLQEQDYYICLICGKSELMKEKLFNFQCSSYLKLLAVAVVVCVIYSFIHSVDARAILLQAMTWIRSHHTLGPIVYILLYVLFGLFCLPTSVLTFAAGVLYGTFHGALLAYIGALGGASCAFFVGRHLVRNWVLNKIEKYPKFKLIDEAIAKEGFKIVLLARLSPLFPYCIMNYCFSLSKVSFKDFLLGSLGMLFWTVVYAYSGSLIGKFLFAETVEEINVSDPNYVLVRWIVRIVGLLATILVTVYVSNIASIALNKELHE
jgi:uncharacterized membrane protein YdjX (TVP38/TMEM64 family)